MIDNSASGAVIDNNHHTQYIACNIMSNIKIFQLGSRGGARAGRGAPPVPAADGQRPG